MTVRVLFNLKTYLTFQVDFYEKYIDSLDDTDDYDKSIKESIKNIHTEYSLALEEINEKIKSAC